MVLKLIVVFIVPWLYTSRGRSPEREGQSQTQIRLVRDAQGSA